MAKEGREDYGEKRLRILTDQTHEVVIAPVIQSSLGHLHVTIDTINPFILAILIKRVSKNSKYFVTS